jgi:hypothetical protein
MGQFFVDTSTGHVATLAQLNAVGIDEPEAPWHRIQAPVDATTLWQAVMVKSERGVFIGTLTLRHGDHHALLLTKGWQEIPPAEIGANLPGATGPSEVSPSPWSE